MGIVLCTWNPNKWTVSERAWDRQIRQIRDCGFSYGQWSIGSSTKIVKPGDIAFLLRQGSERGIVAQGEIASEPFAEPSWNDDAEESDTANYVEVIWTAQIPIEKRLRIEVLRQEIPEVNWSPFSSGTTVKPPHDARLLTLWSQTLQQAGVAPSRKLGQHPAPANLVSDQNGHCGICGIDPETMYQIAPTQIFVSIRPTESSEDLAVCPNCAVYHSTQPMSHSVDELQRRLSSQY
jgi:hypothetical protein